MSILIDPAVWQAHGRVWSHLISDTSFEELHAFAAELGVPARGFEGDHYDLPAELYQRAVDRGAIAVTARELLTALQTSGLRRRKRRGEKVVHSVVFDDGRRVDAVRSRQPPAATGLATGLEGGGWVDQLWALVDGDAILIVDADGRGELPHADEVNLSGPGAGHAIGYVRWVAAGGDTVREQWVHALTVKATAVDAPSAGSAGIWRWVPLVAAGQLLNPWTAALLEHLPLNAE